MALRCRRRRSRITSRAARVDEILTQHREGDIRDATSPPWKPLSAAAEPEVVFHLAAQPLVRDSYAAPQETFDINVMGTCNVLECVRRREKPCVVLAITTDKCYENREQVWGYRESDRLGGHDPYSASKAAARWS